jgi:hypothetical protein
MHHDSLGIPCQLAITEYCRRRFPMTFVLLERFKTHSLGKREISCIWNE